MSGSVSTATTWLRRPAVDAPPGVSLAVLAGVRVLAGLMWLYNVAWKQPPDFGQSSGSGVYGFTRDAVDHPVFPPYSWVVEHVVLPHFTPFGWAVLVVESLLAVALLTGSYVRVAALVGVAQSLAIGLSVAQTPGEWPWSYWLMIGLHLALVVTASGAVLAVDAVRTEPGERPDSRVPRLVGTWGVVFGLTGAVALALAAGDPWASSGASLGGSGLSVSLGTYNLLGAAVLLAVAVLMLAAAALRRGVVAYAAAVVAGLAALSLYIQLSRTDVWLGGNNTSAAFLLCAVAVAVPMGRLLDRPVSGGRQQGADARG